MPPESPRKSSTSSGNHFDRPRYLLLEVSGAATLSPRSLEPLLAQRSIGPSGVAFPFRVIRVDAPYALVAVEHTDAPAARSSWNAPGSPGGPGLKTLRSYGTLRNAKLWIAERLRPADPFHRRRDAPAADR